LHLHYLDIAQSKFVLCPSGLGFDTYRLWETIILGSIPIVEVYFVYSTVNPLSNTAVAYLCVFI
jgi:hypothetical protein